jgi:hypothetical protein
MWRFLAILRRVFHSSLLYTLSFHPFPPTSLPSSLTSSCYLFLGLPLSLVVSRFIYTIKLFWKFCFLLFSVHAQTTVLSLTLLSVIVGLLTIAWISLLVNILHYSFSLSFTGPKILLYTSLSKIFICFLSLFVSIQVSNKIWEKFSQAQQYILQLYNCHWMLVILQHVSTHLQSSSGFVKLKAIYS